VGHDYRAGSCHLGAISECSLYVLYHGLTTDTEEKTGEKFRLGIFELREDWNVPQNEK
jgi:hypothetical protein